MISTILDADDISILDLHLHRVLQELLHFSCIRRIKLAAITTQLFCKCLVICLKEPIAVDGGEDGRWRSEDSLYTPLQGPLGPCQRDAPTLPREEFCRGLVEAGKGLFAHS